MCFMGCLDGFSVIVLKIKDLAALMVHSSYLVFIFEWPISCWCMFKSQSLSQLTLVLL